MMPTNSWPELDRPRKIKRCDGNTRVIIAFHVHTLFRQSISIGFHGNVVVLWEKFAQVLENTGEMLIELGSDQTSCHVPFNGGYYPVQLGFEEANEVPTYMPAALPGIVCVPST